jgi:hypothetical protein
LAVSNLELQFAAAADHLLGGHTVGDFRKGPHEFDAPARDNEGFEAAGPEIGK